MLVIFEKVLSIFLIIGVGFGFGKGKILPHESQKYFSTLLIKLCLPCMILASITEKEITENTFHDTIFTLLFGFLFYLAFNIVAFLLSKYVFKVPREDLGAYILLFATNNTGFLGFPITLALFGPDILFYMVIFNITLTIQCNALGPVLINIGSNSGKFDIKKALKDFFNINTICSIVALVMMFSGLHFPSVVFDCIDTIGDVTVSLSLFIIGMQLSESKFKKILKNYRMIVMGLIKMLIIPVVMFLIVNPLDIAVGMKICFVLASALPTAAATTPVAQSQGRNSLLCAEYVAFTTLISVVIIPLTATFLTNIYL